MSKKINVLFLGHHAELGGGELWLLETVKHLSKEKFKPIVALGADGPLNKKLRDVRIETIVMAIPSYFRKLKRGPKRENSVVSFAKSVLAFGRLEKQTAEIIKQKNISLVFANTVKSAMYGIPAAKKCGIKSVWMLHDFLTNEFYKPVMLKGICMRTKHANLVLCNSKAVKEVYLNLAGRDFSEKTVVVYNGVDLKRFNPSVSSTAVKRELGLTNEKVVSLIGRLEPWKGQKVFIKAAKVALSKRKDLKFLIVGGPLFGRQNYEKECKALIKDFGLEKKVLMLGFREDVPNIISASHIITHTSTNPEPFGRDVIESMACGKPVIATNIGGPLEIISSGSGVLISANNPEALSKKIIQLLNDHSKMKEISAKALERAKYFDIKINAKEMEEIFTKLVRAN